MSKHRIFVASLLPEKMQERLSEYTKKWQDLKVRWYRPEDLHITLVPPWMESDVDDVIKQLEALSGQLSCQFEQIDFGPTARKPRLIWADVKKNDELTDLYDRTHELVGCDKEDRPFRPHVTLGRFKPSDFHQFPIKKLRNSLTGQLKLQKLP